jgi:hypothetical protein
LRCTGGDRDQILGLGWGCGGGLQIIGVRAWGCGVVKRRYTCHHRCKICVGVRLVVIEAWKRRKKKNHRKEAWKRRKKRRQLKLDRLKLVPHRLKLAPPAIAGLNTGYSRSTRVSYVLALKPSMSSIPLVTKLPLACGCLYIWLTLPLPKIEMN